MHFYTSILAAGALFAGIGAAWDHNDRNNHQDRNDRNERLKCDLEGSRGQDVFPACCWDNEYGRGHFDRNTRQCHVSSNNEQRLKDCVRRKEQGHVSCRRENRNDDQYVTITNHQVTCNLQGSRGKEIFDICCYDRLYGQGYFDDRTQQCHLSSSNENRLKDCIERKRNGKVACSDTHGMVVPAMDYITAIGNSNEHDHDQERDREQNLVCPFDGDRLDVKERTFEICCREQVFGNGRYNRQRGECEIESRNESRLNRCLNRAGSDREARCQKAN